MIKSKTTVTTRYSDLDTQRHVTSRTYEDFFLEGRMLQLFELGLTVKDLLDSRNQFTTEKFKIFFNKEQGLHSQMDIISKLEILPNDEFYWNQEAFETGTSNLVCSSSTLGKFRFNLNGFKINSKNIEEIKLLPEENTFLEIQAFSGNCSRISREMNMLFSDRGMFYEYNNSALLRLLEESRWIFSQEIGLTEELIHELDTITFFMGVDLKVYAYPVGGEKLVTKIWIYKIEKFRLSMRIDMIKASNGEVLLSALEQQLIVSLSKRRPRKANDLFLDRIQRYIEITN